LNLTKQPDFDIEILEFFKAVNNLHFFFTDLLSTNHERQAPGLEVYISWDDVQPVERWLWWWCWASHNSRLSIPVWIWWRSYKGKL